MQPKKYSILPGFGLSLGFTVFYLSLVVIVPLSAVFFKSASLDARGFLDAAFSDRTLAAYRISFSMALLAAIVNALLGYITAWVLARYDFKGKKILDALIDLPFALPTAVSGIALTAIFAPKGMLGETLYGFGIQSAYSTLGILIAMVFIGIPFVVRTVEPVIADLDPSAEEAAHCLGASPSQTFLRVIFPQTMPALLIGFVLAFSRALGEYGSVVFISGNMPMKTEIAPVLIVTKLEQYDYPGATAVAAVLLVISFALIFCLNMIQRFYGRIK